jgi:uncharacterized membrane protein YhaH (DUF805 family)
MYYTATQGLFTFQGNRNRMSFLGAALLQLLIVSLASLVYVILAIPLSFAGGLPIVFVLAVPFIVGLIWLNICISFQRMRDIGFSDTTMVIYFLAMFIPYLGNLLALALFIVPGKK